MEEASAIQEQLSISRKEADRVSSPTPHESVLQCPHEYITSDGVCAGCGTTYAGWSQKGKTYYSKGPLHVGPKSSDRSILQDLAKYNYPEDIKHNANEIFHKIGAPTKRSHERNKMLFYLVYTSHRELGRFVNPQILGKEMGLNQGDINRALTQYSEVNTGYRPRISRATPLDAIPELCASLDLEHITEPVKELGKEIMEKCPSLIEQFPHKVAAGILRYFMEYNGIEIPSDVFKKKVDWSDVTIKDIHQQIAEIHNT